jgi:hypothetical protein
MIARRGHKSSFLTYVHTVHHAWEYSLSLSNRDSERQDWGPLIGQTLCDSCYSTFRKHGTLVRSVRTAEGGWARSSSSDAHALAGGAGSAPRASRPFGANAAKRRAAAAAAAAAAPLGEPGDATAADFGAAGKRRRVEAGAAGAPAPPASARPARERKPSSRLRDALLDGPYYHTQGPAPPAAPRSAGRPRSLQARRPPPAAAADRPPSAVEADVWETPAAAAAAAPPLFAEGLWAAAGEEAAAEDGELCACAEGLWGRDDGRADADAGGHEELAGGACDYAAGCGDE